MLRTAPSWPFAPPKSYAIAADGGGDFVFTADANVVPGYYRLFLADPTGTVRIQPSVFGSGFTALSAPLIQPGQTFFLGPGDILNGAGTGHGLLQPAAEATLLAHIYQTLKVL